MFLYLLQLCQCWTHHKFFIHIPVSTCELPKYTILKTFLSAPYLINIFKLFWLTLGQRKTSLVIFLWKRRMSSVVFMAKILFLMAWYRPLEIINLIKLIIFWLKASQSTLWLKKTSKLYKKKLNNSINKNNHNTVQQNLGLKKILMCIF